MRYRLAPFGQAGLCRYCRKLAGLRRGPLLSGGTEPAFRQYVRLRLRVAGNHKSDALFRRTSAPIIITFSDEKWRLAAGVRQFRLPAE
jgi:hypothetical protein